MALLIDRQHLLFFARCAIQQAELFLNEAEVVVASTVAILGEDEETAELEEMAANLRCGVAFWHPASSKKMEENEKKNKTKSSTQSSSKNKHHDGIESVRIDHLELVNDHMRLAYDTADLRLFKNKNKDISITSLSLFHGLERTKATGESVNIIAARDILAWQFIIRYGKNLQELRAKCQECVRQAFPRWNESEVHDLHAQLLQAVRKIEAQATPATRLTASGSPRYKKSIGAAMKQKAAASVDPVDAPVGLRRVASCGPRMMRRRSEERKRGAAVKVF